MPSRAIKTINEYDLTTYSVAGNQRYDPRPWTLAEQGTEIIGSSELGKIVQGGYNQTEAVTDAYTLIETGTVPVHAGPPSTATPQALSLGSAGAPSGVGMPMLFGPIVDFRAVEPHPTVPGAPHWPNCYVGASRPRSSGFANPPFLHWRSSRQYRPPLLADAPPRLKEERGTQGSSGSSQSNGTATGPLPLNPLSGTELPRVWASMDCQAQAVPLARS